MSIDTGVFQQGERPVAMILDPIHSAGVERLADHFELIMPKETEAADQTRRIEVAVVRTMPVTDEWMAARPRLKLIVKHGSGVDNIDIPAATRRGIQVANTPGGTNASAVAEGAVTLMLATLRRVCEMDRLMREDRFNERWSLELGDLTGARVGLLGFGQIARHVARICGSGFRMEVASYDPFVPREAMLEARVEKVEDLLEFMRCDVISVHVPYSPKTHHIVGARELAAMKPTAIIVNTARGGLIDEEALAEALSAGRIRGAGIDVFEPEPPQPGHPLLAARNAVLSPHVAGVTNGSMRGMALAVADVVETVMAGLKPATLLNPNALGGAS